MNINSEFKKNLNTASYVLNAILAVALIVVLQKSGTTTNERIAQRIANGERGHLAVAVNRMPLVNKVEITDVQITNNIEPYEGYIVSYWDCGDENVTFLDTVYVPVKNIVKKDHDYTWEVDWSHAYMEMMGHSLGLE